MKRTIIAVLVFAAVALGQEPWHRTWSNGWYDDAIYMRHWQAGELRRLKLYQQATQKPPAKKVEPLIESATTGTIATSIIIRCADGTKSLSAPTDFAACGAQGIVIEVSGVKARCVGCEPSTITSNIAEGTAPIMIGDGRQIKIIDTTLGWYIHKDGDDKCSLISGKESEEVPCYWMFSKGNDPIMNLGMIQMHLIQKRTERIAALEARVKELEARLAKLEPTSSIAPDPRPHCAFIQRDDKVTGVVCTLPDGEVAAFERKRGTGELVYDGQNCYYGSKIECPNGWKPQPKTGSPVKKP